MEVVNVKGFASAEAIEIKLEDIESDTEIVPEQPQNLPSKCIKSKDPQNPSSSSEPNKGLVSEDKDEGEFQYICTVKGAVRMEPIIENPCESVFEIDDSDSDVEIVEMPEYIVQSQGASVVSSLGKSTGEVNSGNGQIKQKSVPQGAASLNGQEQYPKSININTQILEILKHKHFDYGCLYCQYLSTSRSHIVHHIRLTHMDGSDNDVEITEYRVQKLGASLVNYLGKTTGKNNSGNSQIKQKSVPQGAANSNDQEQAANSKQKSVVQGATKPVVQGTVNSVVPGVANSNDQKQGPKSKNVSTEIFEVMKYNHIEYGCKHCEYLSTSRSHIVHHIRFTHHSQNKMEICPYCKKKFLLLDKHIVNVHHNGDDQWFHCGHCSYKAKKKPALESHMLARHIDDATREEFSECKECGKRFRTRDKLKGHINRQHTNTGTILTCDFCNYTSKHAYALRQHFKLQHASEEELKCTRCDFLAPNKKEHMKHMRQEHGNWLQCHICPYRTPNPDGFKLHLIYHQDKIQDEDLKYRCQQCDYKTYRLNSFKVHMLTHKKPEELEMFQCYHCDFKAKRKDNLKTHIFKHDVYKNVLRCCVCSFETRSKWELNRHLNMHSDAQRKEAEKSKRKRRSKKRDKASKN